MTKFKEIEQALLEIGCTQSNKMFPENFSYEGYTFEVSVWDTLSSIFSQLIRIGEIIKARELGV